MKLKLTLEINLDKNVWGTTKEETEWLKKEVLNLKEGLSLHSNLIGDSVGKITKVSDVTFKK